MDLPPPPPHAGLPPGGPLPAPAPALVLAHDDPDASPRRASRLSGAWRWTLGLGWCVVLAGLGALAQSAFLVDADPWWLAFKPLPFALPVAVLLALVSDSRRTLPLSAAGAAMLVVIAVVDAAGGNPVVAVGEAVCAGSAVLLTAAAALGREGPPAADVPGSVA